MDTEENHSRCRPYAPPKGISAEVTEVARKELLDLITKHAMIVVEDHPKG